MHRRQIAKPCNKKSYTHKFFCLSGRRDCKVPQLWEKMDLESSGLGERKIFFPDWRTEPDLARAAYLFRHSLLKEVEDQPDLVAKMDLLKSPEERERDLLTFYKNHVSNWAHPLCVLLKGDSAFGEGVKRHFFSFVMSRVQYGFGLNLENCGKTLFFNGQEDHLVPSTSRLLLDSDLFCVIGRMIGHSFLHGGPLLTGLSRSLFSLLIGQKDDLAVVELLDCPDTDVTDIVSLFQDTRTLTEEERDQVNSLAISWDLPAVTEENRKWLAQSLLYHAVIGRREKHIRQIRQGLKDTGILRMVKERPCLIDVLFPRASAQMIEPEMILDRIIWPTVDSDDEECGGYCLEDTYTMTGFFRQYIENGTSEELKELIQFWVGWGLLPQNLYVEVSNDVSMPTASTCRELIKLPAKYNTYDTFCKDLKAAVSSTESGFGLV